MRHELWWNKTGHWTLHDKRPCDCHNLLRLGQLTAARLQSDLALGDEFSKDLEPRCGFGVPLWLYAEINGFLPFLERSQVNRFTQTCTNLTAQAQGHSRICRHVKHVRWREAAKRKHLGLEIGYCTPTWDGFTHMLSIKPTTLGR